jgi:hypothetical protein
MFCINQSRPLTILICSALIGLLALPAPAADRSLASHRVYAVVDRFNQAITHITLTDDQKPKVDKIFQNASAQADEMAAHSGGPTRAEKAQALGDFAHQLHQQLAQVLNVGQMETLQLYLGPGPTSRPTVDDFSGGNAIWKNLPKALAKLDLSTAQRQQVDDVVETSRQKLTEIRAQTANGAIVQSQVQQLRQDVKTKLESILNPDQMQSLLQTMDQLRLEQSGSTTQPQKQTAAAEEPDRTAPRSSSPSSPNSQSPSLRVGDPIPDMKIAELNGNSFIPANYKGHILVLEFGSASSPEFRDQLPALEKLKTDESQRAFFLMVYTSEASPSATPQPTTLNDRKLQAYKTQESLKISTTMAVDSIDDSISTTFGTFPSGAVVIGKDGHVAALEHSTSPDDLRAAIDKAYDVSGVLDH